MLHDRNKAASSSSTFSIAEVIAATEVSPLGNETGALFASSFKPGAMPAGTN
jgi:hypothetical protein